MNKHASPTDLKNVTSPDLASEFNTSFFGDEAEGPRPPVVTISKTVSEVYNFLRDLSNLQKFMTGIRSISPVSDKIYRWIAEGVTESATQNQDAWTTEIVSDLPNKLIAWRTSGERETFRQMGVIALQVAPGGRGTQVMLKVNYESGVGKVAGSLARVIGKDPRTQSFLNLRRLKAFMETGEIPTTDGQPNGKDKSESH